MRKNTRRMKYHSKKGKITMQKKVKCSRCHEKYIQTYHSKMGQICKWCEEDIIALDKELSRKCGIRPMTRHDVEELNKYWQKKRGLKS